MAGVLDLAVEVHDRLVKLVAPASPASIEASSLARARNPALFFICVCAGVSFLIFIIPAISSAFGNNLLGKDLSDLLQIVGGAGLGSSFYALHTAASYIKSSTFEPKYNNTYLIRFALGLLSGIILAKFLIEFFQNSPKIGVAALALMGGYAAEAVAQILDRVSASLVALVSGSDKDKIDAAKQKADADAEKKAMQALSDTVKKLQQAASTKDPKDPDAMAKSVQKVISEILDRK
jgi:hypothetical protein